MSARSVHHTRPRASSLYSSRSLPAYSAGLHTPERPHTLPRRPATARTLRSSPLTRQSCEVEDRDGGQPKYRPSRISSIPDLSEGKQISPTHLETTSQLRSSISTDAILPVPPIVPWPTRPPSISRDPGANWVTKTDPTPRFSRLGLGGDGVVMPVSAKSHRKASSRPTSMASISSSRAPSLLMDSVPPSISRTTKTSFSSIRTSVTTPVDFGMPELSEVRADDCGGSPEKGKVRRLVSSFFKSPLSLAKKNRTDGGPPRRPQPEIQVKETDNMRRKWKSIVTSMRR